jgi:hypothetical protein
MDSLDPIALLFKFGFLTIDQLKPDQGHNLPRFSLKIPNFKASMACQEVFARNIFKIDHQNDKYNLKISLILSSIFSILTYLEHF